jgi:branched-chain amino acid transport system permease protein
MFFVFVVMFELFDKSFLAYKLKFIKESEFASKSFGINIFRTKLLTFSLVAAITAFNGGVYAYYAGFISPVSFNFHYSIQLLTMAIVGGVGSVSGGIVGAAILTALPEFMTAIEDYEMVLYGLFLAVTIIFLPEGLSGLFKKIVGKNASN